MSINRFGFDGVPDGILVPSAATSFYLAVTTGAQNLTTSMVAATTYVYSSNVDTFIKQGGGTASAGAGSMFVPGGMPIIIDGTEGAALSVLGLAIGHATLQKAGVVR